MHPGLIRIIIATLITVSLALLYGRDLPDLTLVGYGLCIVYGLLHTIGVPKSLTHPLVQLFADLVIISIVVGATGGGSSPLLPLYLLAAMSFGAAVWAGTPIPLLAGGIAAAATAVVLTTMITKGALRLETVISSPHIPAIAAVIALAATWVAGSAIKSLQLRTTAAQEQARITANQLEIATELLYRTQRALTTRSPHDILDDALNSIQQLCHVPYAHAQLTQHKLDNTYNPALERQPSQTLNGQPFNQCWLTPLNGLISWTQRTLKHERVPFAYDGPGELLAVPIITEENKHLATLTVGGPGFDNDDLYAITLVAQSTCEPLLAAADAPGGRDPLTKLPNYSSLRSILRRDLSPDHPQQLVHAHIPSLRTLELTYGRPAIETLLKHAANAVSRGFGSAFCIGEGQFAVLLPLRCDTTPDTTATHLKQRIENSLSNSLHALPYNPCLDPTQHYSSLTNLDVPVSFADSGSNATAEQLLDHCTNAISYAPWSEYGIAGPVTFTTNSVPGTLLKLLQTHNPDRVAHMRSVAGLARRIGQELRLPTHTLRELEEGALLHDIGELSLPTLLAGDHPEAPASSRHQWTSEVPLLGASLADRLGGVPETALSIIAMHRERCDGTGYPGGLHLNDIPLEARITHVADAMDHSLRQSLAPHPNYCHDFNDLARIAGPAQLQESLHELSAQADTRFDSQVLGALFHVIDTEHNWTID